MAAQHMRSAHVRVNHFKESDMLRKILSYGSVAGLIVGGVLFTITVTMKGHPPPAYGMAIGYLTMLIALSAIFVGVKQHRDKELGGVIRFWRAFGMGLAISLVASVFYIIAWEAALAVTKMDFAGDYAKLIIEQKKAKGASAEAIAKLTAEMDQFKVQYANPLFRIPMTFAEIFPVGLLVSLISAALLRNARFMPLRRDH
jgi:hypothetical protein